MSPHTCFPGSGIHSLWSNGNICLFVQGPDLKRLNPDYTATTVLPGVGPARMVYVEVAGTVYLTNGTVIGYVREGAFTTFPDPGQTYKTQMIPGHLIEYFNGRLYVARDNEIWFSDPMALGRTDERRNFKQLPSRVTLMSAVDDGIYVSDLERTYFMGGGDPGEAVLIDKTDYPAIPYTAQKIDAARIGGLGLSGSAVPVSHLCLGDPKLVDDQCGQFHLLFGGNVFFPFLRDPFLGGLKFEVRLSRFIGFNQDVRFDQDQPLQFNAFRDQWKECHLYLEAFDLGHLGS